MVEDPNGGKRVGMKQRHKENDEDDIAEIIGTIRRQKPLEDNIDLFSMVVAINQPRQAQ